MTFVGLIWRCLLSLALVSNGLASGMGMPEMEPQKDAIAAVEVSPCHHADPVTGERQPATKSPNESIPDCCKDARCQCACNLQISAVAISLPVAAKLTYLPPLSITRTEPVRVVSYTPLLRPPIA